MLWSTVRPVNFCLMEFPAGAMEHHKTGELLLQEEEFF